MTADEFKQIRLELGLTQWEAARAMLSATRTIQSYEYGERKISRLAQERMLEYKHMDKEEFKRRKDAGFPFGFSLLL